MMDYKLSPVKKIFTKKIVHEDGSPKPILEVSEKLGMITKEELDILIKLKMGDKVDDSNKKVIQSLLDKHLIEPIK